MSSGALARTRAATIYGYLMARGRLERRSERVLKLLEKVMPAGLAKRSLLAIALSSLCWYAAETVFVGLALAGSLLVAGPETALSLLFASLLLMAAVGGLSTVTRTVTPPDEERLLLAPISERGAFSLAFWGASALGLAESVLVLPIVSGISASVVLGEEASPGALWGVLALVSLSGCALALVVNRSVGSAWVRRVRRGARGYSTISYGLLSVVAFGAGALLSRALAAWLSDAPAGTLRPGVVRWIYSLPRYALDTVSPVGSVFAYPASPFRTLARVATGAPVAELAAVIPWIGALLLVAAGLWAGAGRCYRNGWRDGRQEWSRGDLLDLAEKLYVGLARSLYRGDYLLEVQICNLCRQRERILASPFDLFGGPLLWVWGGLALGSAPALQGSPGAAAIFVLVVGGWAASETVRLPFESLRNPLAVDAEGRRVGLYRVAGVGVLELHGAKLKAGRLVASMPLGAVLVMIAVLARLPPASCLLLAAVGLSAWAIWSHAELLPGLASPHFGWKHPDELGGYSEQQMLSGLAESAATTQRLVDIALIVLFLAGWIPAWGLPWMATMVRAATTTIAIGAFRRFGRQAAWFADGLDLPP